MDDPLKNLVKEQGEQGQLESVGQVTLDPARAKAALLSSLKNSAYAYSSFFVRSAALLSAHQIHLDYFRFPECCTLILCDPLRLEAFLQSETQALWKTSGLGLLWRGLWAASQLGPGKITHIRVSGRWLEAKILWEVEVYPQLNILPAIPNPVAADTPTDVLKSEGLIVKVGFRWSAYLGAAFWAGWYTDGLFEDCSIPMLRWEGQPTNPARPPEKSGNSLQTVYLVEDSLDWSLIAAPSPQPCHSSRWFEAPDWNSRPCQLPAGWKPNQWPYPEEFDKPETSRVLCKAVAQRQEYGSSEIRCLQQGVLLDTINPDPAVFPTGWKVIMKTDDLPVDGSAQRLVHSPQLQERLSWLGTFLSKLVADGDAQAELNWP